MKSNLLKLDKAKSGAIQTKPKLKFAVTSLALGSIVIVYVSLGIFCIQKEVERRALQDKIVAQHILLQNLSVSDAEVSRLQTQYSQIQSELATSETGKLQTALQQWSSLPLPEESIEIYSALLNMAQQNNLTITGMDATNSVQKEADNLTYSILSFNISADGDCSNLLSYIRSLRDYSQLTQTIRVDSATINLKSADKSSYTDNANIKISIMSQPAISGTNSNT